MFHELKFFFTPVLTGSSSKGLFSAPHPHENHLLEDKARIATEMVHP